MSAQKESSIPQPDRPAFHRRPKETANAYAAFKAYCAMGPDRAIEKLAISGKLKVKGRSTMLDWSRMNDWVARAAAWDADQDEKARRAQDEAMKAEAAVWAKRQHQVRQSSWEMAQLLIEKAKAMLEYPLAKRTVEDGGATIHVHPQKFTIGQAGKMIEVADKLQRLAAGLNTEKTEITGPNNSPLMPASAQVVILELPPGRD